MAILQRWKNLYGESEQYIKEIMAQVLDLIETVSSRVEKGVRFSYICRQFCCPKRADQILQRLDGAILSARAQLSAGCCLR